MTELTSSESGMENPLSCAQSVDERSKLITTVTGTCLSPLRNVLLGYIPCNFKCESLSVECFGQDKPHITELGAAQSYKLHN